MTEVFLTDGSHIKTIWSLEELFEKWDRLCDSEQKPLDPTLIELIVYKER